jgi:hypothetical protein
MENNTPNTNAQGAENNTAAQQEKTFTQADVDKMIQSRLDRERKKMPSEEELTAFRTWKDSQQTEQDRMNNITKERDTAVSNLSAANAKIEQLEHERYVSSKGFTGDEAEFITFKAAKMVDDKTTFEQAVDAIAQERRPRTSFDWTAPVGDGNQKNAPNAAMNALIRGAIK